MFGDMGYSEIVRCLYTEIDYHGTTGSVWHDKQRVSELTHTGAWTNALFAASPQKEGDVRIMWSVGDNLIFRLEFPLEKLIRSHHNSEAYVKTAEVQLFAMYGADEAEIRLSPAVPLIDFGTSLEVIPDTLWYAAHQAIDSVA